MARRNKRNLSILVIAVFIIFILAIVAIIISNSNSDPGQHTRDILLDANQYYFEVRNYDSFKSDNNSLSYDDLKTLSAYLKDGSDFDKGIMYLIGKDYDMAVQNFNNSIYENKSINYSKRLLADAFVYKSAFSEAAKLYDEILTNDSRILHNRGFIAYQQGQYETASILFNKSIELDPNYAMGWYRLANSLIELRKFDDALYAYNLSVILNPVNVNAWYNIGTIMLNMERFNESIIAFDKAIEIDPGYSRAYGNKGNALAKLKDFNQSIVAFNMAITLEPGNFVGWYNLGNAYLDLEKYNESIIAYNKTLELSPSYTRAWYDMATAYKGLGDLANAKIAYDNYQKSPIQNNTQTN